ncbi:MAG: hypothetical protein MJ252_01675, partial [archaeon]|nr:hypothetical protein [archaeon]
RRIYSKILKMNENQLLLIRKDNYFQWIINSQNVLIYPKFEINALKNFVIADAKINSYEQLIIGGYEIIPSFYTPSENDVKEIGAFLVIDLNNLIVIQRIEKPWIKECYLSNYAFKMMFLNGKDILVNNEYSAGFTSYTEDFIPEKFFKLENFDFLTLFELPNGKLATVSERQLIKIYEFN